MQFQLFSAWHAILEQSVEQATAAETSPAQSKDDPSPTGQAVVLALPFSSLQLDSSLVQYLELTPEQISAIAQVMARERPYVAPLMAKLDATKAGDGDAECPSRPETNLISGIHTSTSADEIGGRKLGLAS